VSVVAGEGESEEVGSDLAKRRGRRQSKKRDDTNAEGTTETDLR